MSPTPDKEPSYTKWRLTKIFISGLWPNEVILLIDSSTNGFRWKTNNNRLFSKNYTKFTEKHIGDLQTANLLKKTTCYVEAQPEAPLNI